MDAKVAANKHVAVSPEEIIFALERLGEDPSSQRVEAIGPLMPDLDGHQGMSRAQAVLEAVTTARTRLAATTIRHPHSVILVGTSELGEPVRADGLMFEGGRLWTDDQWTDASGQVVSNVRIERVQMDVLRDAPLLTISDYVRMDDSAITAGQYVSAQREINGIEMAYAMGEELPHYERRLALLERMQLAAPWERDMDSGAVVPKPSVVAQQASAVPGVRPLTSDEQINRLCDVQQWTPALMLRLVRGFIEKQGLSEKLLDYAQQVANNENLIGIREGDASLEQRVARAFGYASREEWLRDSGTPAGDGPSV